MPFSPVHSARKFSAVLGTMSVYWGSVSWGSYACDVVESACLPRRGEAYELESYAAGFDAANGDVEEAPGAL
jgi:hypothetical protein